MFVNEPEDHPDPVLQNNRALWAALYLIWEFVENHSPPGTLPSMETLGPELGEMAEKIVEALAKVIK